MYFSYVTRRSLPSFEQSIDFTSSFINAGITFLEFSPIFPYNLISPVFDPTANSLSLTPNIFLNPTLLLYDFVRVVPFFTHESNKKISYSEIPKVRGVQVSICLPPKEHISTIS